MNIKNESLSGIALNKGEFLDSFVLHIPHSSTVIPNEKGFILDKLEENINQLTDWATDNIFDVDFIEKIITPFSRLFCDVERFDDDLEPMVNVGRGFFYTNGYDGSELRKLDLELKNLVYAEYYLNHHKIFYNKVKERLDRNNFCHIIDCHSFNDNPIVPFFEKPKSPDICIGTDEFHTPEYLLNYTFNYFTNLGYSVEINDPYYGCIIPKQYYLKNDNVKGIMIEINKRIYMDENVVNNDKVTELRDVINGYFNNF